MFSRHVDLLKVDKTEVKDFEVEFGGMDYGFQINGILGMDFLIQAKAIIDLDKLTLGFS